MKHSGPNRGGVLLLAHTLRLSIGNKLYRRDATNIGVFCPIDRVSSRRSFGLG